MRRYQSEEISTKNVGQLALADIGRVGQPAAIPVNLAY
jgi:hypothetical protein